MLQFKRISKQAVVAGLSLALSMGTFAPAFGATGLQDEPVVGEYSNPSYNDESPTTSTGETKLYISGPQSGFTTPEGSVDDQIKVSIPVAIHYVADASGNLVGPTNNTVKFVNHTKMGAVHVAKISVSNATGVSIVKANQVKSNDQMSFSVTPAQGQSNAAGTSFTPGHATEGTSDEFNLEGPADDLGSYVNTGEGISPTRKNDWNIAQKDGALALNNLGGKIGGLKNVSIATDYQVGTIHWTVRGGTRQSADLNDASVTVHYHPNQGTFLSAAATADQQVEVLKTADLPTKTPVADAMGTKTLTGSSVVSPPAPVTNADGSVTTYSFASWNTQPDGLGTTVETLANLGTADQVAGKTFEVYAIYTSSKS